MSKTVGWSAESCDVWDSGLKATHFLVPISAFITYCDSIQPQNNPKEEERLTLNGRMKDSPKLAHKIKGKKVENGLCHTETGLD